MGIGRARVQFVVARCVRRLRSANFIVAVSLATATVVALSLPSSRAGDTAEKTDPTRPGGALSPLDWIPDAYPTLPRVIGYEYNQKNHHDAPSFEGASSSPLEDVKSARKKYRVLGVVARNPDSTALEARIVLKPGESRKVKIPAGGEVAAYFSIVDVPGSVVQAELRSSHEVVIAAISSTFDVARRATVNRHDADFVAAELNNEERVREAYPSFPVSARVLEAEGKPLVHAKLTLLHDQLGLVVAGETDGDGQWQGRLLAGAWTALAFGQATVEKTTHEGTVEKSSRIPKAFYLVKAFDSGPSTGVVELKADQTARVKVRDEAGAPLEIESLSIAPHKISEPLRFADVRDRCSGSFIFDLVPPPGASADGFEVLTNKGTSDDVAVTARVGPGIAALLALPQTPGDGELVLTFAPSKMLRLIIDPPTGAGGGVSVQAAVTPITAPRRTHDVNAVELETVFVPATGPCRVALRYSTRAGEELTFAPRRLEGKPGSTVDLTPRAPFSLQLFTKDETQAKRGLQCWCALSDATGQIVDGVRAEGTLVAWRGNEKVFERAISPLSFAFPAGQNLADCTLEGRLRIGTEVVRARASVEPVRRFSSHGTWAAAPSVLQEHVEAFLGMVQKSCESEKRFLGGPAAPVGMDFQIFLPPGVGGLGGGGTIALDLAELLRFADETDPLPRAYCHELGHNVGFGHDPYMLLAPTGVEEGTYGPLGYRMANGSELATLFRYLERHRCDDRGTWTLGSHVFDGMRLLYGPDVHKKMFEQQRMVETGLTNAGLSSIERIAVLYSLALGDNSSGAASASPNVAWLFRAYGWPVVDQRVSWGISVARTGGRDVIRQNADKMDVAAIRRWWFQGPLGDPDEDEPAWQAVTWPTDFIAPDVAAGKARPARGTGRYRLFTRITVPQAGVANLVAAADVALEVFVNGHAVARLDASPQLSQPVHDELMLDHKKAFPVLLLQGENTIECAVSEIEGSRGFVLGLCGMDGKPMRVGLRPEGPSGETPPVEVKLKPWEPVLNSGFEDVSPEGEIAPWIRGPIEGQLQTSSDDAHPGGGKRSLRLVAAGSCTGGLMQRVVVEPGAVYGIHAKVRAENLDGDAQVICFTGDIHDPITKTPPVAGGIPPRWTPILGQFVSQQRRCVYVCCYVKAKSGTVWFDDVELVREK